jgi:putative SOS response-associated peptidase YedK
MCNRFNVKGTARQVAEFVQATLPRDFLWKEEMLPLGMTPGVWIADGRRELVPMQFGLAKPGAEEPGDRKFPNNNARVEKYDKWPWKDPFKSRRCVVPLSSFREPCYWGEPAGKEVNFHAPDQDYLGVACLYNLWKPPTKGEPLVTMTFLMRPACRYVMEQGHHRQPFFLHPDGFNAWMAPGSRDTEDSLQVLQEYAFEPELAYEVVRELAPSWKSRRKAREADRDEQLAEIGGRPLGI